MQMARKPSKGKAGKSASLEQMLARLEGIVERLEGGELSLDESLALYEEGVRTLGACHGTLGAAEKKIEVLVESASGVLSARPMREEPGDDEDV